MAEMHNIDANLIADMQKIPTAANNISSIPPSPAATSATPQQSEPVPDAVEPDAAALSSVPHQPDEAKEQAQIQPKAEETSSSSNIDEYGNPVSPPRVYTEEEVNRMMSERFSRRKAVEQSQPQGQQPQQAQQPPANQGDDEWQSQLKEFIFNANDEYFKSKQEAQWRAQEAQRQADFEARFNSGINKYSDFREVVAGKNISDGMMLAARSLDNPAAFIYGAAKLHPQEVERISKISDPYAQAMEAGRLHERMVKNQRVVSQAPKPIEPVKGDISQKAIDNRPSIEQRIAEHAKRKFGR